MAERPELKPGERVTIGHKYGYAVEITDQAEADSYFAACVDHFMSFGQFDRDEAERIELLNIVYYSGYCSDETRQRVKRLFGAKHPVFNDAIEYEAP